MWFYELILQRCTLDDNYTKKLRWVAYFEIRSGFYFVSDITCGCTQNNKPIFWNQQSLCGSTDYIIVSLIKSSSWIKVWLFPFLFWIFLMKNWLKYTPIIKISLLYYKANCNLNHDIRANKTHKKDMEDNDGCRS